MRIIYVGFRGTHNASCLLVRRMSGEGFLLRNSFSGLAQDVEKLPLADVIVYLFGTAKDLTGQVRIECCAEQSGQRLSSALPLTEMQKRLRSNGIESMISEIPTAYLCNDAYYRLLARTKGRAVLLHIPGLSHITEEWTEAVIKSLA